MKVVDAFEYKRAKEKRDKLKHLLKELDLVGEILYNNMEYSGVWELIKHLEEIRIYYYIDFHEANEIVKQRKTNVKQ